jgi:hypothetical protein
MEGIILPILISLSFSYVVAINDHPSIKICLQEDNYSNTILVVCGIKLVVKFPLDIPT